MRTCMIRHMSASDAVQHSFGVALGKALAVGEADIMEHNELILAACQYKR